jgi:hypothetical protein
MTPRDQSSRGKGPPNRLRRSVVKFKRNRALSRGAHVQARRRRNAIRPCGPSVRSSGPMGSCVDIIGRVFILVVVCGAVYHNRQALNDPLATDRRWWAFSGPR